MKNIILIPLLFIIGLLIGASASYLAQSDKDCGAICGCQGDLGCNCQVFNKDTPECRCKNCSCMEAKKCCKEEKR